MSWLTQSNARKEVLSKASEITTKIDDRRAVASLTYENEIISRVVGEVLGAGNALKKEWFFSSVGIDWGDEERETWYVSKALVAATFVDHNVVHWTHWIGQVETQIREYVAENGAFPDELTYGPRYREMRRKVGPLVNYQFKVGQLVDCDYSDSQVEHASLFDPVEQVSVGPVAIEPSVPSFGLRDIIQLKDLTQDNQIRGPMAGIYILTGGPGVGKTSVALHRIPYLLMEQFDLLPIEVPSAPQDFFSTETMHIVVWKQHLVPYLKKCLTELNFGEVPVHHVDDWVRVTLRDYVRMGNGRGEYRIERADEPEEFLRMKLGYTETDGDRWAGITESMLSSYLTGRENGEFHNPLANQMVNELQDQIAELTGLFHTSPLSPRFRDPTADFVSTVAGIEAAIHIVLGDLERISGEVAHFIRATEVITEAGRSQRRAYVKMRPKIRRARRTVNALRERLIDQRTKDYPTVLSDFYKSGIVGRALVQRFGQAEVERFFEDACVRLENHRLTRCDRYLLLWLVHTLTQGAPREGTTKAQPLPQYSHTVVDEAQYYDPIVLRLLVDLAKAPLRSVTIVGDLEQKVKNNGGLVEWKDAGIMVEPGKLFRLNTNYRWSTAVFGFLDIYRRLVNLHELRAPRKWASGAGLTPTVTWCQSEDDQESWLIDRVSDLRRTAGSIAVVVPPGLGTPWQEQVIGHLASCDIRARWATGEDVHECEEQVILTDYESIVGLEFDRVLLPGCERVLTPPNPSRDAIQAAWVALTRARKYVGVSHVDPLAIFDDEAFREYRFDYVPSSL